MNDPVYKQVSRGAGDLERNCGALVFLALSRFYLFGVCFFLLLLLKLGFLVFLGVKIMNMDSVVPIN